MSASPARQFALAGELVDQVEQSLDAGETVEGFVTAALRERLQRRREQAEFLARGLASLEQSRRENDFH